MDQNSPTQPPQKSRIHPLFVVGIVVAALVAIGISVFVLMNPRGAETNATETASEIVITERGVAPPTVTVKKGSNVTWKNQDTAEHQIALTTPNPPSELEGFGLDEALASGETYSFTFEATGTFT